MRAVVAASAWPSHFAMTASGTPRRCNAVPQEWRASCSRIGRTPADSASLCHILVSVSGVYGLPGLIHRDVAAVGMRRAQHQPVLRVAD